MRQQRKSRKISFGKQTLNSIRIQIETILDTEHSTEVDLISLKPIGRNDGNFVLVRYSCAFDPSEQKSRLFAVKRFGDLCDVWLAGPESGEFHNNDAA